MQLGLPFYMIHANHYKEKRRCTNHAYISVGRTPARRTSPDTAWTARTGVAWRARCPAARVTGLVAGPGALPTETGVLPIQASARTANAGGSVVGGKGYTRRRRFQPGIALPQPLSLLATSTTCRRRPTNPRLVRPRPSQRQTRAFLHLHLHQHHLPQPSMRRSHQRGSQGAGPFLSFL